MQSYLSLRVSLVLLTSLRCVSTWLRKKAECPNCKACPIEDLNINSWLELRNQAHYSLVRSGFHSRYHTLNCVVPFGWLALVVSLNAWDFLVFFLTLDGDFTTSLFTNSVNVVLLLELLPGNTELLLLLLPHFALSHCLLLCENRRIHPLKPFVFISARAQVLICSWLIVFDHYARWNPLVRGGSLHLSVFLAWWNLHTSLVISSWKRSLSLFPLLVFFLALLLSHLAQDSFLLFFLLCFKFLDPIIDLFNLQLLSVIL